MINTNQGFGGGGGGVKIGGQPSNQEDAEFEKAEQALALQRLVEAEKAMKFRDKSKIELENVQKQAHHTRTKVRIKFPDGYIL